MTVDDLRDLHVLVTGASGALGGTVVAALMASGARVTAVARRRTALDALRADLRHHERLNVAEGDVSAGPETEALFSAVERGTAPLDGVVHCAGTYGGGTLAEVTDADVARLVAANFTAAVNVLRASLRRMVPRAAGRVVLTGSLASEGPSPGAAVYGATKAALAHLCRSAAAEAGASGVTVNALLPGMMDTPDNRAAMPGADPARWVATESVAKVAAFLLGPSGAGVTGTLVHLPDRMN